MTYVSHWPRYKQVIQYPRVTLISIPDFDLTTNMVQPMPGCLMTFVHLDVYFFNKSVLKTLLHVWSLCRPLFPPMVFCHGEVSDDKFDKFVKMFGWQHLVDAKCTDGNIRKIYVHISKPRSCELRKD